MTVLDVKGDAARAFSIMQNGGIAILPNDVGYSLIAGEAPALRKIFDTKRRAPSKLNAMLGNANHHREIHAIGTRAQEIVEAITVDYDLPLGIIAPCRRDHPMLTRLDPDTYQRSTAGDTLLMLMQQHNVKEEGMLYPMAARLLGGPAWGPLGEALAARYAPTR